MPDSETIRACVWCFILNDERVNKEWTCRRCGLKWKLDADNVWQPEKYQKGAE